MTTATHTPEIDYAALLRGVWRRQRTLVAVVFLLIAGPGVLFVYFTSAPVYVSKALVSIEPAAMTQLPFLREPPRRDTIATHMVLLKSRSLSEAVVEALPKESYEELLTRPQYIDYWIMVRNRFAGWLKIPPAVFSDRDKAMIELQKARMDFSPSKEAENVFVISATATKPRVAMDLVNTHIQVLLNRARSVDHDDARRAREFLESQYQQIKDSLARAEDSAAKLQQQKGRLTSGGQTELELVRLAQLESSLADTQANRQALLVRIERLRSSLDQTRSREGGTSKDSRGKEDSEEAAASLTAENQTRFNAFKTAQDQLARLEAKLASLRERYTEAHPQVQTAREEVTRQQARVTQLARELPAAPRPKVSSGTPTIPTTTSDRQDLQGQLGALEREAEGLATKEEAQKLQVARLRGSLRSISQDDVEFGNVRRSIEANRNLLAVLSDRLMAARIREQGDSSVIRIVDPASLPLETTSSKSRNLAAMILGLAGSIAFGLAFGLEFLRQPIDTETDILKATGLPTLGSVGVMGSPTASKRKGRSTRPILLSAHPMGTSAAQNQPIHAELYRAIRANIETERLKSPFRSILVTSPAPHEGKSTTILNLGHVFQEFGRRVLIIEADIRRPSIALSLALTTKPGIVDYLHGAATFEQVCRRLPSGVTVIPGQVAREDSASLLASAQFKELLHVAGTQFDLILVDSAPILAVPDNLLLVNLVDRVVLVAKATATSARDLRKAQEVTERGGGQLLGVVLNQANQLDVPYYHPKYRKYYSSPTGKRSEETSGRAPSPSRVDDRKIAGDVAGRKDTREMDV